MLIRICNGESLATEFPSCVLAWSAWILSQMYVKILTGSRLYVRTIS